MLGSIQELAPLIRSGQISPVELTRGCLERIEKLDPSLNAFITIAADAALVQARAAEKEITRGRYRGPLHGIPIGLKDVIDTAGLLTTAASGVYKDRIPTADAKVVRRVTEAGAVILGKQNLHEFAYGASSLVSSFGPVRNPWDTSRITGGSSGGSAAAVAVGLGFAAIGTDTAGSIRLPAAYCGVVGLKPTYGRVSSKGVIPLSPSLDHVGPITRTVGDALLVFQAIAEPVPAMERSQTDIRDVRIGVPREHFFDQLDAEIASAVEVAIGILRPMVAEVRDVVLTVDEDRTLQKAESFMVHKEAVREKPSLYQPETLRRIRSGETISVTERQNALNSLNEQREHIREIFSRVDLLVTPTVSVPPGVIEDLLHNPDALRPRELRMLRNTRPFNVWGIPAVSIPCGFTSNGLPIGLQIAGPLEREDLVLEVALAYEQATPWHLSVPEAGAF
ncbi:MAG: amidase [Pseudomonadota bacterium]